MRALKKQQGLVEGPLLYAIGALLLLLALGTAWHFYSTSKLEAEVASLKVELNRVQVARDAALVANGEFKTTVEGLNEKVKAAVAERDASDAKYKDAVEQSKQVKIASDKKIATIRKSQPVDASKWWVSWDNDLTGYIKDRQNETPIPPGVFGLVPSPKPIAAP